MEYFGIKTPGEIHEESYIWWISDSPHKSWSAFFTWPGRYATEFNTSRPPMATGIKAYEAIGYKCVALDIKEVIPESQQD